MFALKRLFGMGTAAISSLERGGSRSRVVFPFEAHVLVQGGRSRLCGLKSPQTSRPGHLGPPAVLSNIGTHLPADLLYRPLDAASVISHFPRVR